MIINNIIRNKPMSFRGFITSGFLAVFLLISVFAFSQTAEDEKNYILMKEITNVKSEVNLQNIFSQTEPPDTERKRENKVSPGRLETIKADDEDPPQWIFPQIQPPYKDPPQWYLPKHAPMKK
jgi:hypothetical protein